MIKAVRTCLASYFTFSGRARRPEYWWFLLAVVLAGAVASLIDAALFGGAPAAEVAGTEAPADGAAAAASGPVGSLVALVTFVPLLAVGWRRMHDTGRSGWFYILPTLVVLAGLALLALFAAPVIASGDAPDAPPGWLYALLGLTGLAVLAAWLLVLVWLASRTQPGPNVYGPEPPPW